MVESTLFERLFRNGLEADADFRAKQVILLRIGTLSLWGEASHPRS
jgi:hypothetical protein